MASTKGISLLQFGNCQVTLDALQATKIIHNPLLPPASILRANSLSDAEIYMSLKPFDVVLLAIDFEQDNSESLLEQTKHNAPRSAIIVVTQLKQEQKAIEALTRGATDYLTLDELNPKNLVRVLRYSIDKARYTDNLLLSNNLDSTTGLTNRSGFMNQLQRQLSEAERLQFHLFLFYVDCDNFKVINDTLGHQKGDDFLAHFASHLKGSVRSNDFVARLSADEFVVLINSKDNRVLPSAVVSNKILQSVRRGIQLSSGEYVESHCSIGITHYNGEGSVPSADKFLQEAASALKQSKKKGGDCTSFFDRELGRKAERRIQLLKNIRIAFKRGEFHLHYQPILEATTDRVVGFEALLRWNKGNKEAISPAEFVPILEETGMIHIIGSWVIFQACEDFSKFLHAGYITERSWISVNISPLQLQDPNFTTRLEKNLRDVAISADHVHLEITESSLMEKSEFTFQTLDKIKQLGCKLSLDDFGVGYSSMNHLKELPIDTLKIDQSFVRNFKDDESDKAMIRAIVSLAHNLGKKVVAEGIENIEAAAFLKQRRCEYLQGYLYSKPLPLHEAMEFTRITNKIQHNVLLDKVK